MFFELAPRDVPTQQRNPILDWQAVWNQGAPRGQALHTELAKDMHDSVQAAAEILTAQAKKEIAPELLQSWDQRARAVRLIPSRDIQIDKLGKMVGSAGSKE